MAEFHTEADSERLVQIAREKIHPVLMDAVAWRIHEAGLNFTHEARCRVKIDLMIALAFVSLGTAAAETPNACMCENCLTGRSIEAMKAFIEGIFGTMRQAVEGIEGIDDHE